MSTTPYELSRRSPPPRHCAAALGREGPGVRAAGGAPPRRAALQVVENALADEYGLSRPTVRRAIAVLTEEGHLYAVPGRGTYVAGQAPEGSAPRA
ncbi:GntR family transcriptional regulator [Streptomyces sp. NPDC002125]